MAFFKEVMGMHLSKDIIRNATARTEGWQVGLHMLGLSLQGHTDPSNLLDEVSGTTCSAKLLPIVPSLLATIWVKGLPPWHSASRPWPISLSRIFSCEPKSLMPSRWPITPQVT